MDSYTGAAEGGSSTGSSVRMRMNNIKHYTENARLQEAIKLFSTLEEDEDQLGIGDEDNDKDSSLALINIRNVAGISPEILDSTL